MVSQVNVDRIGYMTETGMETVRVSDLLSIVNASNLRVTYNTIDEMVEDTEVTNGIVAINTEEDRGGLFQFSSSQSLSEDLGCVFNTAEGQWVRLREDSARAYVEWYGDTSSDIQRAVDNNSVVEFQKGKTYTLSSVVTSAGKDIRLEFNGARLYWPSDNQDGLFHLFGGWSDVLTITGQGTDQGYLYFDGDGSIPVQRGDIVKLSTEGTYSDFQNQGIAGEFIEAYKGEQISGSTRVIIGGDSTSFSYTNGTALMSRLADHKIEIIGPVVVEQEESATTADELGVSNGYALKIGSALNPTVENVRSQFCYWSLICTWSCYNANISNVHVGFSANQADGADFDGSGFLGYAIRDCNSTYTKVSELHVTNSRHGYVAIGSGGGDGGPVRGLSDVGPNRFASVFDSSGASCSNTPFDTHHGSEYTEFRNCHSQNNRGSGYQARGRGTQFYNCTSVADDQALMTFVQSAYIADDQARTDDTLWKGGVVINPRTRAFRLNEASQRTLIEDTLIEVNRDAGQFSEIVYASDNSDMHISNMTLSVSTDVPNMNSLFSVSAGVRIYVKGVNAVFSSSSLVSGDAVFKNVSNAVCYVDDLKLWRGNFTYLFDGVPDSGGIITNIMFESPSNTMVSGLSNEDLGTTPSMVGPISDGRSFSYGKANYQKTVHSEGGSDPHWVRYTNGEMEVDGSYESAISVELPVKWDTVARSIVGIPYNENSGDQTAVVVKNLQGSLRLDTKTSSGGTSSTPGFFVAKGRWF